MRRESGAQNRIRTGDLVLTKDVLCQLSYLGRPRECVKKRKRVENVRNAVFTVNSKLAPFSKFYGPTATRYNPGSRRAPISKSLAIYAWK